MQLPAGRARYAAISEGLTKIAEHVSRLAAGVEQLNAVGNHRAAAVVAVTADEDAAKFLMLLDFVRMGSGTGSDQEPLRQQLKRCYSHLARCLYVEVTDMHPATFREIRLLVEQWRRSRYLDGPNDVDWVFRNQLIAAREEALYVDYVRYEGEHRWVSPADYEPHLFARRTSDAALLVASMVRAGFDRPEALPAIAAAWNSIDLEDATPWPKVETINQDLVGRLQALDLMTKSVTSADLARICDRWTYPLHGLDLTERSVSTAELEAQRDHWYGQQL